MPLVPLYWYFINITLSTSILSNQLISNTFRETKEIFIVKCPGNKCDKGTLEKLIMENVEKGTKIITDGWAAYKGLRHLGYEWDSVNHSTEFVK